HMPRHASGFISRAENATAAIELRSSALLQSARSAGNRWGLRPVHSTTVARAGISPIKCTLPPPIMGLREYAFAAS
ncbi:hypothetical protein, partial [Mycolicibacterium sp.]|uniref:hypothetical protein n=1 Tax=Mycolicibacterium sp. TaxID=2320850 RepID=UPI0037CC494B